MSEIAELFYPAVRWDASRGYEGEREGIEQALKLGVGGFILFGGPAEHVAALTEDLHSKSRNPLLIGADLERGAGQQFAGQTALPPLAAIASLGDVQAIRRAAAVSAREARELGINWIYAPDCDLDVEPNNPIIGTRSFGSDPEQVGEYAGAWIDALIMEGVLGGGEAEAVVRAVGAGCDCLLYPSNIVESELAVRNAIDENRLDGERVHQSIERRKRWARWAALSRETNRPVRDESGWSSQLAEQVVHMVRGKLPALEQPWHLVIVDDDVGGPYPAPSRDPLISTLRAGGVDLSTNGDSAAERGATVIALFGDIRAWKGRPGYSTAAKADVQRTLDNARARDRLIIQFSHPRLADELDVDAPILCAWGGEAVMQRAAARVLLRAVAANSGARSAQAAG